MLVFLSATTRVDTFVAQKGEKESKINKITNNRKRMIKRGDSVEKSVENFYVGVEKKKNIT